MVNVIPECDSYNANFFAEASALYWHPRLYGTEFALESLFMNNIFKVQQRVVLNLLIYVGIGDLKSELDTVCPVMIGILT